MIISKAIELLDEGLPSDLRLLPPDTKDAIRLGIEALKHLVNCRKHPFSPFYGPLPSESMPERGIR